MKKDDLFAFKLFCPHAGPAFPFPVDEKEAIPGPRDVKTNPRPCVLTAFALAPRNVNLKLTELLTKPNELNRLQRKSVKKTEAVGDKKISLCDDWREEFVNF